MSDVDDEMKVAADYAIKAARERYKLELDFSEQSISSLEIILGQIYWGLSNRTDVVGEDALILKTANIWGSYLGEYMRLKWGGTWMFKGPDRILSINNIEFLPINLVYRMITSHPESSVKNYLIESEKLIYTSEMNPHQAQKPPAANGQTIIQFLAKLAKKPVTNVERAFFIIISIGAILIVALFCLIGYTAIKAGGISAIGSNGTATTSNTNILLEKTLVTEAAYSTNNPTVTLLPTWTSVPSITRQPSSTPTPTNTPTATFTPTETRTPLAPTLTRIPTKSPTSVNPTDTHIPASEIPPATWTSQPTLTATATPLPVIQSCEINPSTVPAGLNTTLTFTAHFSGPGQGFDALIQASFPGQSGCSATDTNGDGVASCDGTSGLLPNSTKVDVIFRSSVGDCTASFHTP